jgi:hypothetical protein
MPLIAVQILLALAIVLTASAGVWLMINARSVACLFRGSDAIEPGPNTGRHARLYSKRTVLAVIVALNIGWISAAAIWSLAVTQEANEVVEARTS